MTATHSPQSVYEAVGSTTAAAKPDATAASKALPPSSSMRMPAIETSGWPAATTPRVPDTTGRMVTCSVVWCSVSGTRPLDLEVIAMKWWPGKRRLVEEDAGVDVDRLARNAVGFAE